MSRTRTVIYCRKCGEKSLWFNPSRGMHECLNCKWEGTTEKVAGTPHFQGEPGSREKVQPEKHHKRVVVQCKKCGKESLWFNSSRAVYQCLNRRCRWEGTAAEYASMPAFQLRPKPPVFQGFEVPVWLVRTLESKGFWVVVGCVGVVLWLTLGLALHVYNTWSLATGLGLVISTLVATRFVLKRFVRQYTVIAASSRRGAGKGRGANWVRRVVGSSWLRLLVVLVVIAGLVAVPWTGYLLFTHQMDPVIGTITFVVESGLLIWLVRVLGSSRRMSAKPSFKLVFFSVAGIALVCAFAGIEPLTSYKDVGLDYVGGLGGRVGEWFETRVPPAEPVDRESAIAKVKPAVVRIDVGDGGGSGMVIDELGHILTCNHVVESVQSATVSLMGKQYEGSVVRRDELRDVAIVKIMVGGSTVPAVTLGDSGKLQDGEEVVVIGYPLGSEAVTYSKGIFSGFQEIDGVDYIQTDAAINPGNSGGPLINLKGEVIAIVSRKVAHEWVEGMGFAVPINDVKDFVSKGVGKEEGQESGSEGGELSLLELEKETFGLINGERERSGMRPIVWNEGLHIGARKHSENMQESGTLYHETGGQFPECCYGGPLQYSPSSITATGTVNSWMSSPGHRAIVLDGRYGQGAVGIARDEGFFATYRCY